MILATIIHSRYKHGNTNQDFGRNWGRVLILGGRRTGSVFDARQVRAKDEAIDKILSPAEVAESTEKQKTWTHHRDTERTDKIIFSPVGRRRPEKKLAPFGNIRIL